MGRLYPGPEEAQAVQADQDKGPVVGQDCRPEPGQAKKGGEEEEAFEAHGQGDVLEDHPPQEAA
jgi:hypothetical protein